MDRAGDTGSLVTQVGARLGRDSLVYTVGTAASFPLGLVIVAVTTRYLGPVDFGRLGVLITYAGLLTVVMNLVVLQGTIRLTFGGGGDEGDAGISDDELPPPGRQNAIAGTGIVLTLIVVTFTVGMVYLLQHPLANLLVQDDDAGTQVVWATVCGATGAIWRICHNMVRMERRPLPYAAASILRPSVVAVATAVFLISGGGVTGALQATAAGTVASMLYLIVTLRGAAHLELDRSAAEGIVRRGLPLVPVVIGLWFAHNVDLFVLAAHDGATETVGLYRLASRLASILSYLVSAYLLAWSPLEKSVLFTAAYERHPKAVLHGWMIFYFVTIGAAVTLALSVGAEPVIRVLAPGYEGAAPYVPVTCAGFLTYALLIAYVRASQFPKRYLIYGVASLITGLTVIGLGTLLVGPLGAYGVAAGSAVGPLVGLGLVIFAAGYGVRPAVEWGRIGLAVLLAAALWFGFYTGAQSTLESVVFGALAILLYPAVLFACGLIPATHRGQLVAIVKDIFARKPSAERLLTRLRELPATERAVVVMTTRDRLGISEAGVRLGLSSADAAAALTRGIGVVAELGAHPDGDGAAVGAYLATDASVAERDAMARALWQLGVTATDLHELDRTFATLRSAAASDWAASSLESASLPPLPWDMAAPQLDALARLLRSADDLTARPLTDDEPVRCVRALRSLSDLPETSPQDRLIAAFLFGPGSVAAIQLWEAGVDPLELHQIELRAVAVRRLSNRSWAKVVAGQDA